MHIAAQEGIGMSATLLNEVVFGAVRHALPLARPGLRMACHAPRSSPSRGRRWTWFSGVPQSVRLEVTGQAANGLHMLDLKWHPAVGAGYWTEV